jgi:Carboxypeptidase regulatory-like domain
MATGHRVCASACLTFALFWTAPEVRAADTTALPAALAGRVVDEQGQGVAGAKLTLQAWRDDEPLASATSAADGSFTIEEARAGCRNLLLIDAEGFGREFVDHFDLFPQHTTQLADVCLAPGCVCRGRVLGADGQPVANVEIALTAYRHELGHTINQLGPAWHVTTGGDGRFTTPPLPPCYLQLAVAAPAGFVQDRSGSANDVGPQRELELADLKLVKEVPIEGVVISKSGLPVFGAEVWHSYGLDKTARTDLLGHFTLHGCSEKTAPETRVGVEALGYAGYQELKPVDQMARRIVLEPCRYISGRAVDVESGQPVKLSRVVVCEVRRDENGTPHSYGCGEARFVQPRPGEFRAAVSGAGEKHLTLMADGYDRGEDYVLGDAADDARIITVKMRRSGSAASAAPQRLRGVVRRDGRPAAGVWVSLWQKKKEWNAVNAGMERGRTVDFTYRPWAMDVLTDAAGQYLVDVPEPGEYFVVASPPQGAVASSPPLSISANQEQTCDLELKPGGTIRGQLQGVAPDAARRLWVVAFAHVPFRAVAQVDRAGHFVLTDVPEGEIGLKVGHEGYIDSEVPRYPWPPDADEHLSEPWKRAVTVQVASGRTTDEVVLELPPAGPPDSAE